MDASILEHFTNPIRSKIFFEIHTGENLTAKQLLEKLPDISQPTLYRHIKALLESDMISISKERPIRGVVEKSYSAKFDWTADIERIVTENDGVGYMQLFIQYISGIVAEYKAYCESDNVDIINDGTGFTVAPIYATDEELHDTMTKIGEIMQPMLTNQQTPERKLRNLCMIITPPQKQ